MHNELIDGFGRKHDYLRISLTDRCNLRCFYCMPEEGIEICNKSEIMTFEEIIGISKIFVSKGVNKIRLTGGEPFYRRDVDLILEELAKLPVDLRITTNGVNLHKHIAVLKENNIKKINVSLDSLNPDKFKTITRFSVFDKVVDNINLLLKEGFEVKVNTVVMNGINDDEIIDFIAWTQHKPLHVRFIEFMPFNGNKWEWKKIVPYKKLMEAVENKFSLEHIVRINDRPNDTSLNYKIKNFEGTFAFINSVTQPFCGTCNRIRLTADGKLKNCLFSSTESDLLIAYRNGEDILPLIERSIGAKKEIRAGMATTAELKNTKRNQKNRSMVSIGG